VHYYRKSIEEREEIVERSAPSKMDPVSWPINSITFVAIKMGRRQDARSGAYLNGYVTEEQRSRRPIFIATLRAVVSWLFFRVARSLRIHSDMRVALALKSSQLIRQRPDESNVSYGTGH
jgi:hypothetical protein